MTAWTDEVRRFYDDAVEDEDQRLDTHQLEFELTLLLLDRHLTPSARILELGAATGRYTVELARRGHTGLAVDLSPALASRCEARLATEDATGWDVLCADACELDLLSLAHPPFDAVLAMGPFYHLLDAQERLALARRLHGALVDGGLVVSAWISRFGLLSDVLREWPAWISDRATVASVLRDGRDTPGEPAPFPGYFAHPAEVAPTMEAAGFRTITLAAVEPVIGGADQSYNDLQGEVRSAWLEVMAQVCTEPSVVGASRHVLHVGRREPAS